MRFEFVRVFCVMLFAAISAFAAEDPAAAKLYQKHCFACHENPAPEARIPPRSALAKMRPAAIVRALESGVMKEQGKLLSRTDQRALSSWLGSSEVQSTAANELSNPCPVAEWVVPEKAAAWAGWGNSPGNWRFQPEGGVAVKDVPKLKLKWAFAFADATSVRSQPAVFGGRVFMGGYDGSVYSLDAQTGCVHWKTSVVAQIRSGMSVGQRDGRPALVFGDVAGYLYALDAATGRLLWKLRPDTHPAAMMTSTPVFSGDRVIVGVASYEEGSALAPGYVCCSFRGSVLAVDVRDGTIVWKTYMVATPPAPGKKSKLGNLTQGPSGAGVWSSPTLDAASGAVYVTTGDNYSDPPTPMSDAIVALDLATGAIRWAKQLTAGDAFNSSCAHPDKYNCPDSDGPDFDFGGSAMLVKLPSGKRALIAGQKSGMLHAVDPDRKGALLWSSRAGEGGTLGGIQWGPATDGLQVYAALSDIRFKRTRVAGQLALLREPDPDKGGGMFAFRTDNGERMWHTPPPPCGERRPCSPAQSAAVSAIPGVVFSGSVDGHLRAFATNGGAIVWDFDAVRDFKTVNGVAGRGGAFDAGGPVVAGGMLFAGSGYANWGGLPGNVLLAFSVDGK